MVRPHTHTHTHTCAHTHTHTHTHSLPDEGIAQFSCSNYMHFVLRFTLTYTVFLLLHDHSDDSGGSGGVPPALVAVCGIHPRLIVILMNPISLASWNENVHLLCMQCHSDAVSFMLLDDVVLIACKPNRSCPR